MDTKAKASSNEFWDTIERSYGEVPRLVKIVLQINEFNSFLALKGMRYDDKHEFFESLESTAIDVLTHDVDSPLRNELMAELSTSQRLSSFKLKPGHRNCIMNLMFEIEKTDALHFFGKFSTSCDDSRATDEQPAHFESLKENSLSETEHSFSQDEENRVEQNYQLVEEYLTDDTLDSSCVTAFEMASPRSRRVVPTIPPRPTRLKRAGDFEPSSAKRRPDHMYNEEFLAQCMNPRRRRVGGVKTYPNTDEGTRERFRDLIEQSMQCILPRNQRAKVKTESIQVEKDSEKSWAVFCPLCNARIKLSVVFENENRYCNYKRSNFERHLRFKHCKVGEVKQDSCENSFHDYEEIVD